MWSEKSTAPTPTANCVIPILLYCNLDDLKIVTSSMNKGRISRRRFFVASDLLAKYFFVFFMKFFLTKLSSALSAEEMLRMPSLVQCRHAFLSKRYFIIKEGMCNYYMNNDLYSRPQHNLSPWLNLFLLSILKPLKRILVACTRLNKSHRRSIRPSVTHLEISAKRLSTANTVITTEY